MSRKLLGVLPHVITLPKFDLYRRYGGDIDGWTRHRNDDERATMTDADWAAIDELLQRLHVVKGGLASPAYEAQTRALLAECAPDPAVAAVLFEYA